MINLNSMWAICKHTKGAWAVWELSRVLTMNMQKATKGGMTETWNPVELVETLDAGTRRMGEIKSQCQQRKFEFVEYEPPASQPSEPHPTGTP